MQRTHDPENCFGALDDFRILCGLRRGPYGVQRINRVLAHQLKTGKTPHSYGEKYNHPVPAMHFSAGQPVMVTQNDYNLQLFNGDVGIILPDPDRKKSLRAFFKEETGAVRDIALPLLPPHETVFAMTVHKSQGSEFAKVLLILPDQDSPVLTRELIYTGITRARESIEIWGRKEIFVSAVKRRIKRTSGLAEALWGE
ncbi:MAG: ATP-binding domain-containing protein [Deltaproteobacteria bacterium]|jgi:exodeoxyribonuclease V alpha subunit|nr:ATP-binding domain-containing protein [Deltaproteobacteria bacterium]